MRKTINIIKVLALAGVLTACQDPEYPTPVASTTVRSAKILFINASPDAPTLVYHVNNNQVASLSSLASSGYVAVNPSAEQIRVKNAVFAAVGSDTVALSGDLQPKNSSNAATTVSLVGNGSYSVIVVDTVNRPHAKKSLFSTDQGGLSLVSNGVITDNLTAPTAGNAGIRFLNLAPGASSVYLTANGTSLGGSLSTQAHAYKATSVTVSGTKYDFVPFTAIATGTYTLEVRTGSASGTVIATLPSTALADGKLYTIFLSGKAVKIGSSTVVKVPYAVNVVPHN
jgi:hypothetical protein